MPQTSTAVNACDVKIYLEDENGQMVDISGSTNEVAIDFDNDLGDYKSFGSRWKGRLECGSDATFKVKAIYSTAQNEFTDIWKSWFFGTRGHRRLRVDLPNSSTGSDRYEADVFLGKTNGVGGAADAAAPTMLDAEMLPTNGVAHQTVGS